MVDSKSTNVNLDEFNEKINSANNLQGVEVRKYLNGAVYVESGFNATSTSNDDFVIKNQKTTANKTTSLTRISCNCSSARSCKIHANHKTLSSPTNLDRVKQEAASANDLKLSHKSLEAGDTLNEIEKSSPRIHKKWAAKKNLAQINADEAKPEAVATDQKLSFDSLKTSNENYKSMPNVTKKWETKQNRNQIKVDRVKQQTSLEKDHTLSLDSMVTGVTSNANRKSLPNLDNIKWLVGKNDERKVIKENQLYIKEMAEQERQRRLQQEQENFKRWLANKKKEEEKRKLEKANQLEELKVKQVEKERRSLEAELKYRLWLKRKEQEELVVEHMVQEQMEAIRKAEDKEQREDDNHKAFKSWYENSKYKQKPIPPGRGLESLRSSTSLSYVNPVPWAPNVYDNRPVTE